MPADVLVSGFARAHTDGLQHGVSIRISINLFKTFLRIFIFYIYIYISCLHCKKNCYDPNLNEELCRFTFFLVSDSEIYLLNGFDFYFNKPYVK